MSALPPGYNPTDLPGQILDEGWGGRIVDPISGTGLFNANTDYNVVGVDPLTGDYAPIGTDVGFGAAVRRWVQAGVYNGDFSVPPNAPGTQIEDAYNMLPYWSFQPTQSGQIIAFVEPQTGTAFQVNAFQADAFQTEDLSSAANLTQLRFQMIPGGYAEDDAYITQLVPVTTTADEVYELEAGFSIVRVSDTDADALAYISVSFLRKNLLSSLGSPSSASQTVSLATDSKDTIRTTPIAIPDDAQYARLSIGMRRNTMDHTTSAEFAISEVFVIQREKSVVSYTPTANEVTFSSASGLYSKTGKLVVAQVDVTWPTTADASEARISLPFTCGAVPVAVVGLKDDTTATIGIVPAYAAYIKPGGTNTAWSASSFTGSVIYSTS